MKEITDFVKDIGFPCFIALYLLMGIGPKLDKLTSSIVNLVNKLEGRL